MKPVIITVPHGFPIRMDEHWGDYLAPSIAWNLYDSLVKQGIVCYIFINPFPRNHMDMNRPESQNTSWRNIIVRTAMENPSAYLFDIHSYPKDDPDWNKFDIVILKSWGVTPPSLMNKIKKCINNNGITASIKDTDVRNDVVISASLLGLKSVLIECNEKYIGKPNKIFKPLRKAVLGAIR